MTAVQPAAPESVKAPATIEAPRATPASDVVTMPPTLTLVKPPVVSLHGECDAMLRLHFSKPSGHVNDAVATVVADLAGTIEGSAEYQRLRDLREKANELGAAIGQLEAERGVAHARKAGLSMTLAASALPAALAKANGELAELDRQIGDTAAALAVVKDELAKLPTQLDRLVWARAHSSADSYARDALATRDEALERAAAKIASDIAAAVDAGNLVGWFAVPTLALAIARELDYGTALTPTGLPPQAAVQPPAPRQLSSHQAGGANHEWNEFFAGPGAPVVGPSGQRITRLNPPIPLAPPPQDKGWLAPPPRDDG